MYHYYMTADKGVTMDNQETCTAMYTAEQVNELIDTSFKQGYDEGFDKGWLDGYNNGWAERNDEGDWQ